MKSIALLVLLFCALLVGVMWSKRLSSPSENSTPDPIETQPDLLPPPTATTPDVQADGQSKHSDRSVKRIAPEGIYYLTSRVSVVGSDGVIGINPGTKVKMVREVEGKVMLTDGQVEFEAKKSEITNDLDVVEAVTRTHSNRQITLATFSKGAEDLRQQEEKRIESWQEHERKVAAREENLRQQTEAAKGRLLTIQQKIKEIDGKIRKKNKEKSASDPGHVRASIQKDVNALEREKRELQSAESQLLNEIGRSNL